MMALNSSTTTKIEMNDNMRPTLTTDTRYKHSWWRIVLIVLATIGFILVFTFDTLSGTAASDVFIQGTAAVSDKNPTQFTPADWTFLIWNLIFAWQAAWLIYSFTCIFRKSNTNYLYIEPNTLHYSVYALYILNMALHLSWDFLWDREYLGWALLFIFLMFITSVAPLIITLILLERNRQNYIDSKRTVDIWLVRALVHNGLAVYATWLFLATQLNLAIWIQLIYNMKNSTGAATASLSIILVGVIIYFILENFIFYSALAYTFVPWFVLIFGLSGSLSQNYNRKDIPDRNKSFTLALLILCSILFAVRIGLFIVRYIRGGYIPTKRNPRNTHLCAF